MLKPGLYEQIISESVSEELASIPNQCKRIEKIDSEEAPKALAEYLASVTREALKDISEKTEENKKTERQVELVNRMLKVLAEQEITKSNPMVENQAQMLLHILQRNDPRLVSGEKIKSLPRPETPCLPAAYSPGLSMNRKCLLNYKKK